ncbi:MAG: GDP-mannose 4,6-dehydratase [Anaerolinea sp.]|nr:GDP-mannose 4,6-dehydratase [Anaerolinea sp.]
MRVLITGAGGFVGGHLIDHLLAQGGCEIHGTVFASSERVTPPVIAHQIDLRDLRAVTDLLRSIRPDHIYHLAAWARVRSSFSLAWETLENNVRAQLNVILACLETGIAPRILIVSSGEIYGGDRDAPYPTSEDAPLQPANPYSVSKATQDLLGLQYHISHGLPILRARPFNHLGPGQGAGFVAPDFALQIARIEAGLQDPEIRVGYLDAERDFTDVRDIARAYVLIMQRGQPGEAYNVASGKTHTIQYVLDTLLRLSPVTILVKQDAELMKHAGVRRTCGDASRLRQATGWEPQIPLEITLADVLADCRQRIQQGVQSERK